MNGTQRHLDILAHGERGEQRAVLKQDAGPLADRLQGGLARRLHVDAQHLDRSRRRPLQPRNRAKQHRLAGARAADHAQNLAAHDIEVEPVMDDVRAELVAQAANPDHRIGHF
jgi:hypothetical protein